MATDEQVYWRHRIWPVENPGSKPAFDAVMSERELRAQVTNTLAESNALERLWNRPITAGQLQAEMDRIASHSKDPRLLYFSLTYT